MSAGNSKLFSPPYILDPAAFKLVINSSPQLNKELHNNILRFRYSNAKDGRVKEKK